MMVHIVVEGPFDQQLIERLLTDLPSRGQYVLHSVGGRDAARPLARRYLIVNREPVAFVIDADVKDEQRVRQQQRDFEDYFLWGGQGIPFEVIQFVPEIEAIFFEQPGPLERLLGRPLDEQTSFAGRFAPKEMLRRLGPELSIAEPEQLLSILTEGDLQLLRKQKDIARLRRFVMNEGAISRTG